MNEQINNKSEEIENKIQNEIDKITPWYLMTLIKPILAEELIAKFRFDRRGIKIAFSNGQKFCLRIEEIQ